MTGYNIHETNYLIGSWMFDVTLGTSPCLNRGRMFLVQINFQGMNHKASFGFEAKYDI